MTYVSEFPVPKFGENYINLLDFPIRSVILNGKIIEIVVRNHEGLRHEINVPLKEHSVFTFSIGSDLYNRTLNLLEQICKTKNNIPEMCNPNSGTTLFVSGIDGSGELLWSVMNEAGFINHLTYENAINHVSKIVSNFDPQGYFEHEINGIVIARCWY